MQAAVGSQSASIHSLLSFLETLLEQLDPCSDTPRRRGRPAQLSRHHLWLALFNGLLRGEESFTAIWRMLGWEQVGSFAPSNVGAMAVRNRLLRGGTDDLQRLHQQLGQLLERQLLPEALSLAPFAKEVVALDETTLERLRRLTEDLQEQPEDSEQVQVGQLADLFDLRQQQWVRLELRTDVLANCKVNVLLLLEGLAVGSLILTDLGYFSFPWFDYLTKPRLLLGVPAACRHLL
jgi:hypothetical protein